MGNVHLHGLGKAALDRLGQFLRRRVREGARDGADDRFDEFRLVADVDAMKVPAKGDLVATTAASRWVSALQPM